jgi:cation transport protein ChaC
MALKREDILAGRIEEKVKEAEQLGLTTLLPPEQRDASRRAMMDAIGDGEIWLFGYGSLMWNPCIHYLDRQSALLRGFHRNFCLHAPTGRGSPEKPGLMLALKNGGSCRGIAYRIDPAVAEHELSIVWNREMVSGAYQPKLLKLLTPQAEIKAITFVVNRQHPRFVPSIEQQQAARLIAQAEGWLGSCDEYLFSTVDHLDELGVVDGPMHELKRLVEKIQQT